MYLLRVFFIRVIEGFCPVLVDGLGTCFFPTGLGETAASRCPPFVAGIPYDSLSKFPLILSLTTKGFK